MVCCFYGSDDAVTGDGVWTYVWGATISRNDRVNAKQRRLSFDHKSWWDG